MILAYGAADPDAVPTGDLHLPHLVCWGLGREPRGSDARMLELLEPFRGHRGRVCRLLHAQSSLCRASGAADGPSINRRTWPVCERIATGTVTCKRAMRCCPSRSRTTHFGAGGPRVVSSARGQARDSRASGAGDAAVEAGCSVACEIAAVRISRARVTATAGQATSRGFVVFARGIDAHLIDRARVTTAAAVRGVGGGVDTGPVAHEPRTRRLLSAYAGGANTATRESAAAAMRGIGFEIDTCAITRRQARSARTRAVGADLEVRARCRQTRATEIRISGHVATFAVARHRSGCTRRGATALTRHACLAGGADVPTRAAVRSVVRHVHARATTAKLRAQARSGCATSVGAAAQISRCGVVTRRAVARRGIDF